jgi:hypothetical protein
MFDLAKFTLRDMTELGAVLRKIGDDATSMEEVANRVVRYLYENLVDPGTGRPECALVRFFKTHPYQDLESESGTPGARRRRTGQFPSPARRS